MKRPSPAGFCLGTRCATPRLVNVSWGYGIMSEAVRSGGGKVRRIFVGSEGLRSGWGFLLFLLILIAELLLGGLVARFIFHFDMKPPKGESPPGPLLIFELIQSATILVATLVMAGIERRSVWSYGLQGPNRLRLFGEGFALGLACLSLLVLVLWLAGDFTFAGIALSPLPALAYGLVWLAVFTLVGVSEETLFRGYVQTTLARGLSFRGQGFWPAAVVLSLIFGLAHMPNGGETLWGLVDVVVAGLSLCFLLWLTDSLWLPIGFHAAWDWAQSYLFGTPDSGLLVRGHLMITHPVGDALISGGTTGPEGSILATPVQLLCLAGFALWKKRRK